MDDNTALTLTRVRLLALLAQASIGGEYPPWSVDRVLAPVAQQLQGRRPGAAAAGRSPPPWIRDRVQTVFSQDEVPEKKDAR